MRTRLREYRKRAGLTQQELARRMGYKSKSAICMIENGRRDLPLSKARLGAKILGCTLDELTEESASGG